MSTTAQRPAPLEPLQEAVLDTLGEVEGPDALAVRRLVSETAIIAYELGWNVAHAVRDEEAGR